MQLNFDIARRRWQTRNGFADYRDDLSRVRPQLAPQYLLTHGNGQQRQLPLHLGIEVV